MSRVSTLADDIIAGGITSAFGIPGSGLTLALIDELELRGIPFYTTHFEGSAALMAATTGRLSGIAGLSLSIKGPGLTNSIPGIAASWFEAYPLIHIAEAADPEAPASSAHKRMNQSLLVSEMVKGSAYLAESGEGSLEFIKLASSEQPGPVVMELANKSDGIPVLLPEAKMGQMASNAVLKAIRDAKCPIIIAGALAVRQNLAEDLSTLNIPVFSTAASKGIVDENLQHAAGVYTGVGLHLTPEWNLLPEADLVVGIGLTAREVLATKPFRCYAINIEAVDTPGIEGFAFNSRLGIGSFDEILTILKNKSWGIELLQSVLKNLFDFLNRGFLPGGVFQAINRHFHGNCRIILDTGYFCTIGEHSWLSRSADLCLLSGQGRYMGTGIPMAIGASLYDNTIITITVVGDGGIGMYLSELLLAVKHKLPLLVILMSDEGFGSIRTRAIKDGLTQKPLTFNGKSWVRILEGLGIPGIQTGKMSEVQLALDAWKPANGPGFIEIKFSPDEYQGMVTNIR